MSCDTPVLILHSGAGRFEEGGFDLVDYRRSLGNIGNPVNSDSLP
ncbi:MAG: hypothetical protein R6V08_06615 [Desulfuromonadales bacterium]